jgi:hypothetical protein
VSEGAGGSLLMVQLVSQQQTSGLMEPSRRGGVASTMVLQPASPAGTLSISAEEGRIAVPPGT